MFRLIHLSAPTHLNGRGGEPPLLQVTVQQAQAARAKRKEGIGAITCLRVAFEGGGGGGGGSEVVEKGAVTQDCLQDTSCD